MRLDDKPWDTDGWAGLGGLEPSTAASGRVTVHCASHGDLDPKNTLDAGGTLVALDWDAAGTRCAVREAVAVGLDRLVRLHASLPAYVAALAQMD